MNRHPIFRLITSGASLKLVFLRCVLPVLVATVVLPAWDAEKAWGWNDAGHMVVDLVAYDLMDEALRRKAVELLRQHPRFEQHFLGRMPQDIWTANDDDKNRWIFAFAGNWPDLVRDRSDVVTEDDAAAFNRPSWHFVDFPVFLNAADETSLTIRIHINLSAEPPADRDSPVMNVMQAIKNSSRIVADRSTPTATRAIHLCWLCHLLGDSHQPLHTCALFTARRFPDGDSGGNLLFVGERKTLHSYWDGRVLDTHDFKVIRRTARSLASDEGLQAIGQSAAKVQEPIDWIAEGRELARTYVYTEQIRSTVASAEDKTNLEILDLPKSYDQDAKQIAHRRVVMAGYRLADLLRRLLKD